MDVSRETLIQDLLSLANDLLHIKQVAPNIIDFRTNSESSGWTNKLKITFSGRALLDPDKQMVYYWDMISKKNVGWGGETSGVSKEIFVIKGLERSGNGTGFVLGGEKYTYDFGKIREIVRSTVEKDGWQLKIKLIKPKWWK